MTEKQFFEKIEWDIIHKSKYQRICSHIKCRECIFEDEYRQGFCMFICEAIKTKRLYNSIDVINKNIIKKYEIYKAKVLSEKL